MLITFDQSEMASLLLLLRQFIGDARRMSGIFELAMNTINSYASHAVLLLLLIARRIMAIRYFEIYPALAKKVEVTPCM